MDLTRGQREKIQRLLEEELGDAYRAALQRGDVTAVDEFVVDRRRALEQLIRDLKPGPQCPMGQDGADGGVAELR